MRALCTLTLVGLLLAGCGKDFDSASDIDADGDGYTEVTDCDDYDALINPGASETCDGRDNDCDGLIDEDLLGTLYRDTDGDGYGDDAETTEGCVGTGGYAAEGGDCDDEDAAVHPGADESCDGLDNDCDDEVDEDLAFVIYYADDDGDGFGDADDWVEDCIQPSGTVEGSDDCDDDEADINPDADEYCDGIDNDCDDEVDEDDAVDASTWYVDADGDGYGDEADAGTTTCASPSGYMDDNTDCDDGDAAVNPGADEICDADDTDEDCDGSADDEDSDTTAESKTTWYPDDDSDGFGDATDAGAALCEQPSGELEDNTDCDDGDASIHPGADEYCNGDDDDCDGSADEGTPVDADTWYADSDGDGYGDPGSSTQACTQPTGYVDNDEDCDDDDASVHDDCSGDTGDTGAAFTRDGSYGGDLIIDVTVAAMGITDTCTGAVSITVDETATPQLRGSGSCSFAGSLAHLMGSQSGTLDGNISSDPDADGDIFVGSYITDSWDGSFTDDDTLEGAFAGTASFAGIPADYDGTFTVER